MSYMNGNPSWSSQQAQQSKALCASTGNETELPKEEPKPAAIAAAAAAQPVSSGIKVHTQSELVRMNKEQQNKLIIDLGYRNPVPTLENDRVKLIMDLEKTLKHL